MDLKEVCVWWGNGEEEGLQDVGEHTDTEYIEIVTMYPRVRYI